MATKGPPPILVKQFMSASDSATIHKVLISRQDGKCYCSCKGWQMRKDCKHLQMVTKTDILDALELACKTGVLGI